MTRCNSLLPRVHEFITELTAHGIYPSRELLTARFPKARWETLQNYRYKCGIKELRAERSPDRGGLPSETPEEQRVIEARIAEARAGKVEDVPRVEMRPVRKIDHRALHRR